MSPSSRLSWWCDHIHHSVPGLYCMHINCTIFSSMQSVGEKILDWILSYVTTGAVFIAMAGNILICIVFSMKVYRGSTTSMLYRVLAVVQGLNAFLDGINVIPIEIGKDSLFTYNRVTCKAFLFMSCWLRAFVAWVLVNIALERVIGIVFPHRAKILNTRHRYGWQLFGISILLFVLYAPIRIVVKHTMVPMIGGGANGGCLLDEFHNTFGWYVNDVNTWTNMIMSSLLPFVIIVTFNITIICGLVKSRRLVASSANTNSQPVTLNSQIAILLSISIAFILTSLPNALYNFLIYFSRGTLFSSLEHYHNMILLGRFGPFCDTMNNSITLVLYCLCGQKFRKCLKLILCCKWHRSESRNQTSPRNPARQISNSNI